MDLSKLRQKIDALDSRIIELLNERTGVVLEIGKIKSKEGGRIYSPERETEIYQKIDELA